MYYIAQVFGIIAAVILMLSFQQNDKGKLLKYQIFSGLFFASQYLCLYALSGALMSAIGICRNGFFAVFKEKVPVIFLIIIILGIVGLNIIFYSDIFGLFPAVSAILYSIAVWQDDLRFIRIVEVIGCSLYIIYNYKVGAVVGVASSTFEMLSTMVAIFRFDFKHNTKKQQADTKLI